MTVLLKGPVPRSYWVFVRQSPHPVMVTIGNNMDYIRVLFYSYIIPLLQGGGSSYKNCPKPVKRPKGHSYTYQQGVGVLKLKDILNIPLLGTIKYT